MGVSRTTLLFIPVTGALLLAPLALRMPNPYGDELIFELHEASHTVLFFVVQLAILFYLRALCPAWRTTTLMLVTTALCLSFGGLVELVQPLLQRSSSWEDMGRNFFGILAACGTFLALTSRGWFRVTALAMVVLVLLGSTLPLMKAVHRQVLRNRDFPVLMDFDRPATLPYVIRAARSKLVIEDAPKAWIGNNTRVARVTMPATARWSGFVLRHPRHGWAKFNVLRFEVFSFHPVAVDIGVNFYSAENGRKVLRYKSFSVAPGLNVLAVDLTTGAPLDQHHIVSVSWYSISKGQDLELFFDNLRLE
jgi:hypothetical protein